MPKFSSLQLTRREAIVAAGAGLLSLRAVPTFAAAKLGDDGIYHMDWYLESFLDLAEDLSGASAKGKRFAVMWGMKGCPGCKRMHEAYLSDPKVEAYIRDNFEILHLNFLGSREVTDFDGSKFPEKPFSATYDVKGTPTIQFFPETAGGLAALKGQAREVARMTGLPEKNEFLAMFRYVREKAYEQSQFPDWFKKQV
ncbi:MAG: thioredoxin fold domain-containing protein [Afipia sp.]|nr:thioredoxin fold domain-containing protein [Afipia sp.]